MLLVANGTRRSLTSASTFHCPPPPGVCGAWPLGLQEMEAAGCCIAGLHVEGIPGAVSKRVWLQQCGVPGITAPWHVKHPCIYV